MDDAAHYIAVQSIAFMDEPQDDHYVYGGLLEEMLGY